MAADTLPADTLPDPPSDDVISAIIEYLQSISPSQRDPEATAKVLGWAVITHEKHIPWQKRPVIAAHLGVSMPLIDTVLSLREAQGIVRVVTESQPGQVRKRPSTVWHKYVVPCDALKKAVEDGRRSARLWPPKKP